MRTELPRPLRVSGCCSRVDKRPLGAPDLLRFLEGSLAWPVSATLSPSRIPNVADALTAICVIWGASANRQSQKTLLAPSHFWRLRSSSHSERGVKSEAFGDAQSRHAQTLICSLRRRFASEPLCTSAADALYQRCTLCAGCMLHAVRLSGSSAHRAAL